jgi:hypothetical protein
MPRASDEKHERTIHLTKALIGANFGDRLLPAAWVLVGADSARCRAPLSSGRHQGAHLAAPVQRESSPCSLDPRAGELVNGSFRNAPAFFPV